MAFVLADRVKETTIVVGTGAATLLGASSGYQSFSAGVGASNTTYYTIADQSGSNWEVGYGTLDATGLILTRTTVISSSNSGSAVTFTTGTKDVWCDYTAKKAAIQDSLGLVTVPVLQTSSTSSVTPVLTFNGATTNYAAGVAVSGSYLQTILQNSSATAGASTNYVLSNNLGTDSTYYGEFGMNSSVFSSSTPSDFFSINNGIYFSGHDGDISVGSGNGYKLYFPWGSTSNNAHVINSSGAIGLSTNLGTTPATSGTTGFGTSGQVLTSGGSAAAPTWTTPTTGTVTSVTGTAPVVSSGGTTPAISMAAATTSVNGYLTSTDWNTFNGKQAALVSGTNIKTVNSTSLLGSGDVSVGVTSVSGTTSRITSTGGVTPVIDLASGVATAGTTGSSTLIPVVTIDTYGRVTGITTASNPQGTVTSVTGTAPVVSSGGATPAISMAAATTSVSGYLTSTDWNTFNGKLSTAVTSAVAGTGVSVSGSTGAVTFSIGQAVATTSNVQFNSLGVGTAGSGTAGEIRATNNVTAYYSDERLKTKIGNIENALDKVKQIETMVYHANETAVGLGYDASIIEVGVTAQSVQKVQPQVVVPAPIDDKYLTVRYERLVPLLIEAIKELEAQVAELKAK